MKTISLLVRLSFFLGAIVAALAASPADACGCGGYVPREGDAHVTQERALLRWEGETEDIVMSFNVAGQSDQAALIMPVPARATVKLADSKLFDTLQELTKPRIEKRARPMTIGLGGAAPEAVGGAAPVTLLDRQALGPFDVSTLTATDSQALVDWLKTNGYNLKPELAKSLQPYVDQKWYYVAVRLTPGQNSDSLKGSLDPIWVSFQTKEIVYPMRASAAASVSMPVIVYVLAPHRVTKNQVYGSTHLSFADWVDVNTPGMTSALAPFVEHKLFLTKFIDMAVPSEIDGDYIFTIAPSDETYHDVQVEYVDDPVATMVTLGLFLACGIGLLMIPVAGLALIIFVIVRLRRASPPSPLS